jgi:hypothetical protein
MTTARLPPALRSRLRIQEAARVDAVESAVGVPLTLLGTTYTMAQEASWVDDTHFAVGRWDGSLGIYAFAGSQSGPVINCAVNSPAQEGVQMITALDERSFASSNDDGTIAVWTTKSSAPWTDIRVPTLLHYDPMFGAANSGVVALANETRYFVVGHANGYVTIWRERHEMSEWNLVEAADIRGAHPVNPWGLHNIRGIDVVLQRGSPLVAVAGSEDGDLTLIDVPSAKVISKTCYNPAAHRGINALAMEGRRLLVANCAVGAADRNLWAYAVDTAAGRIALTDAVNLAVDATAPQVFNFDVAWGAGPTHSRAFFSSTEEGILWVGTVSGDGKLLIFGNVPVTRAVGHRQLLNLGSAVCISRDRLSVANYDISEFMIPAD